MILCQTLKDALQTQQRPGDIHHLALAPNHAKPSLLNRAKPSLPSLTVPISKRLQFGWTEGRCWFEETVSRLLRGQCSVCPRVSQTLLKY